MSPIHVYSLGAFIAPLQQEFGWSRAQIASGLTLAAVCSGLLCIPVGMIVDRIGPRNVGLLGVLLMAASFALLSTATGTMSNWMFLWGVIAIGTLGLNVPVWTSAVASRFSESRGLALALTLSGASVSAAISPMLATWLITTYGWRTAYIGMATIWAAVVLPVLLLWFRGARDQKKTQTEVAALDTRKGISVAEGLRSPALYKLLLAGGLFGFCIISVVVHFVPILKDAGATPIAAAGIAGLVGIFSIIGRLGTGVLLDRLPGHVVGAAAFLLPVIACALLLLDGSNPVNQTLAAAIFGLTTGSEVDVIAYLAAKHFGLKNYGALYGALVMALAMGTAFGPLAAGAVFDHFASYRLFLLLTMVLAIVSAIALMSLGAVRQPIAEHAQAH